MDKKVNFYIAIIGVDGSGKSFCYENVLNALAKKNKVGGVGDKVLVSVGPGELAVPEDMLRIKVRAKLGILVRMCRNKLLYEITKITELVSRNKIQDVIIKKYKPEVVITDGSPLLNILGWGRYYRPEHFNEREYLKIVSYLTGEKKISLKDTFFYLRHIPELILINKIYSAHLTVPDVVIFLKVTPQAAIQRIKKRGKEIQVHEHRKFLQMLQEAYVFVCNLMKKEHGMRVLEIKTDDLTPKEVATKCQEFVESLNVERLPRGCPVGLAKVNIVATTISGSIKDWKKLNNIESEFKRYHPSSKTYIVDSHKQAFEITKDIIRRGGRIVVSAGGAGTFNSILEGCCSAGTLPQDLRLAFLRKGSADLIGKVLNIPDELEPAAKIISDAIAIDTTIESDVLEVKSKDISGDNQKFHMIGFGGAGVFGDIPYFTESRFIKYYKGVLGYLFGDRGPFLTGANLALAKRYLDRIRRKLPKFRVVADGIDLPFKNYMNIIIMNGDLGKHFPIAKGIPLGSGDFQVTLMEDKGLIAAYKQMIHAWKGDLADYAEELGVQIFRTKNLKLTPDSQSQYFLNVDGLLKKIYGKIEYRLFSRVKLITG
ncbi:MAG: deoxynucleoside kinase [Candidatus Omnitrophica bacterium]|nr:deoxynucleoside kinase [Candidatus Omnitrophota bacterium]MBU0878041.1 deoxynucleoside kinase [Candidatus Omnitrophota bacterium]MBU0896524.1 deoxynucleoside kinase [Candidatus Omnitrophota bacterium]MBU1134692.1 deoxynucleoside kinase [Candidatus Omnitrophota bacterium]MBU1367613.1 deoxynucleoside kinase [Candidatus Omnitrophota bacterium]